MAIRAMAMFSVIFEVYPKHEKFDLYLELAKGLRPILEGVDGFIDNERFESTRRPRWIFSHSTWRDEKSVVRWRTVAKHHETQQRGRDEVFQDYHLRVGEIVLDTAPPRGKFPLADDPVCCEPLSAAPDSLLSRERTGNFILFGPFGTQENRVK